MILRPNLIQRFFFLALLVIIPISAVFSGLLWLATPAQAAQPVPPPALPQFIPLTITPTKISNPVGLVNAGDTVTFTIAFKSDVAGTVIVTDAVPAATNYKAGSITSLVATTTNVVTSDDSNSSVMAWTVQNNVPNTLINLSFAVVVDSLASTGTQIVNVAWLSDTNDITTTAPVTLSVASSIASRIYLPVVLKGAAFSGTSELFVKSINTGGVSVVEVRSIPDDQLILLCGMSDNTTQLCGAVPAGEYTVIATTLNCGQIKTIETIVQATHTITAECLTLPQTTQLYIQTNNTGGTLPVQVRTNPGNNLTLSCTIGDNTTQLCGPVQSGGYTIRASTPNCGLQVITTTLSGSQATVPISCASTITTEVFIETSNTGGVSTIEIRTPAPGNLLKLSCAIPDDSPPTTCGFIAGGVYRVRANTVNCGQIIAPSLLITGTQQTIPVSCSQFRGVWLGRLGSLPVE